MAKTKQGRQVGVYVALIGCQNDATGARFGPGALVIDDDFPENVIANWLQSDPPVLAVKEARHDSSDTER